MEVAICRKLYISELKTKKLKIRIKETLLFLLKLITAILKKCVEVWMGDARNCVKIIGFLNLGKWF